MSDDSEVLVAKQVPTLSTQTKAQKYRAEIAAADLQLFQSLPLIIEKAVEKAIEGKGNDKLLIYLMDRCLGRPTEHKEISATVEGRRQMQAEYEAIRDDDPNELLREYQETIGISA